MKVEVGSGVLVAVPVRVAVGIGVDVGGVVLVAVPVWVAVGIGVDVGNGLLVGDDVGSTVSVGVGVGVCCSQHTTIAASTAACPTIGAAPDNSLAKQH